MRKLFLILLPFLGIACFFVVYVLFSNDSKIINPLVQEVEELTLPLKKYSFENLSLTEFVGSEIEIGEQIEDEIEEIDLYTFYFYAQDPENSQKLSRVSGLLTIPSEPGNYPLLLQFRGYVDREIYGTGVGTRPTAEEFAKSGFITLAPDFLGYGESQNPSTDSLEERFQTYSTALSLFASVKNLNNAFQEKGIDISIDSEKLGIWGHSNGGHIALSTLIIARKNIPTVLWAPVSKPFPYSILYFTDEYADEGKSLRKVMSNFEQNYDVFEFSPARYYSRIIAPLQIHQGGLDDAVPVEWSNEFVQKLEELEIEHEYFIYPGADHNMRPAWDTAVARSIGFYKEKIGFDDEL